MEKKTKSRGSNMISKSASSLDRDLGPLVKAIDDAVASISDEQERNEVRQAVGEAVHGAIRQLAFHSSQPRALAAPAVEAGMAALKDVQNLGFVEFTAGLINGTFDAIIGATVKQMQAYADMVADLAKTLSEFKAENVTDAQINAHLAARYPDGEGGTSVRPSFTFKLTEADPATGTPEKPAHAKLLEVANALVEETKSNRVSKVEFTGDNAIDPSATSFTADQVAMVRTAIGELLAISMIEHLRAMAREGMARIVISNGELLSKLTFRVAATDIQAKQRSQYEQSSFNANVKGGFGGKQWGVRFGASYNHLNVSTMNESSFDSVTMNAEIIGMVKLNFKTESFPPIATETPIG